MNGYIISGVIALAVPTLTYLLGTRKNSAEIASIKAGTAIKEAELFEKLRGLYKAEISELIDKVNHLELTVRCLTTNQCTKSNCPNRIRE